MKEFHDRVPESWRIYNVRDSVAYVPRSTGFVHVGEAAAFRRGNPTELGFKDPSLVAVKGIMSESVEKSVCVFSSLNSNSVQTQPCKVTTFPLYSRSYRLVVFCCHIENAYDFAPFLVLASYAWFVTYLNKPAVLQRVQYWQSQIF